MIKIGNLEVERNNKGTIMFLTDERLIKIDPTSEGFFDKILDSLYTYAEKTEEISKEIIIKFMKSVETLKALQISTFWKTNLDPSFEDESDNIVFEKDMDPAVGFSFEWWKAKVEEMATVEGKKWQIGTIYQYHAFLVWLFNHLIEDEKWSEKEAIEAIVFDSKELGHYRDSEKSFLCLETTGCRCICGCYDLANTSKLLKRSENTFWCAGGNYDIAGKVFPLADCYCCTEEWMNEPNDDALAWLVLE